MSRSRTRRTRAPWTRSRRRSAGVRPAVATSTAVLAALRSVFGAHTGHPLHEDEVVETSGALHLHARLVEAVGRRADALQIRPAADGGTLSLRIDGRWEDVDRLGR